VSRRVASPDLVDRAAELAVLTHAWADTVTGEPRTVLLSGEAGIGKSRLIDDLVRHATTAGGRIARGACVQLGSGTLPYAPFRSAVSDLCAALGAEAVRTAVGEATSLGALLGEPAMAPGATADGTGGGDLFDAVARLLHHASRERPVVLVVEDLHWSDASTRDLVSYLCRALRGSRVLLVASLRSEPQLDPRVDELLDELVRLPVVERLDLHRLGPDGVVRQMAGILGEPPAAEFAERVVRLSAGVPFLVEELTAAGDAGVADVPEGLRHLVLRRTRTLSPGATAALRAVAAAGGPVDEHRIAAVCEVPERDLGGALRELVDGDLLVVDRVLGRYDVRHALLREALDEDLLPGEAAHLHERYALLLEDSGATDLRSVVEAAHHWWVARRPDRAYPAALRAAAATRTVSAYGEELLLLERCLSLWPVLEDPATLGMPDRAQLLAAAGRAARLAGRYETSLELLEQARGQLGPDGSPLREAQVLFEEALLLRSLGDVPGVEDAVRSLLARLPTAPSPARAHALNALVQLQLHHRRNTPELLATVQLATEAAAGADEPLVAAHLQVTHSTLVADDAGGLAAALALLASAWEVGAGLDDVAVLLRVLEARGRLLVARGRFREGVAAARQGLQLAAERGSSVLFLDYLLGTLCDGLLAIGEWDEATSVLEEALRVDRPNLERGGLYARLAAVRCAVGDLDGARTAAETARSRLSNGSAEPALLVFFATVDAELALAEGRPTAALELAHRIALEHGDRVAGFDRWRLLWVAGAASVAASRAAGAGPPRWLVEEITAQSSRAAGSPWADLVTAQLAHGNLDLWQRALSACAEESVPALIGLQVQFRAGSAALSAGDRVRAARLLGEVVDSAETLGARGILAEALDLMARTRLRVAAAAKRSPDPSGLSGLTVRELEVLRLVAAGSSNAAIAALLFISNKTVSVHVSHILDKLGVASRGEAAATAWARGLASPDSGAARPLS
jgi:DNA-binding CsgD family transcriptional regulator/tetratricopeptide (TPR) repeat protein